MPDLIWIIEPDTRSRIALLYEGFISYDTMSIEEIERFFSSFYPKWQKRYFIELLFEERFLGYVGKY